MAKQSGLGDALFVGGFDLSGDIGHLPKIAGGMKPLEVTAINKFAHERLGGQRTGSISFVSFFDTAAGQEHPVLSVLPTADVVCTYCRGTVLGNACASIVAKQINYDGTRTPAGDYTFAVDMESNAYGLEWGVQLTDGMRTDTLATNGSSIDTLAAASFGAQAYLQVKSFTGTDAVVKIQDSANNSTWADVTGLTFTTVTAAPTTERIFTTPAATVRQYLRAVTTTTGGFTSVTFAVQVTKNDVTPTF